MVGRLAILIRWMDGYFGARIRFGPGYLSPEYLFFFGKNSSDLPVLLSIDLGSSETPI